MEEIYNQNFQPTLIPSYIEKLWKKVEDDDNLILGFNEVDELVCIYYPYEFSHENIDLFEMRFKYWLVLLDENGYIKYLIRGTYYKKIDYSDQLENSIEICSFFEQGNLISTTIRNRSFTNSVLTMVAGHDLNSNDEFDLIQETMIIPCFMFWFDIDNKQITFEYNL